MLFNSMLFIFVFLPAVIFLCILNPKKYHNLILLIASFIFYFLSEPKYFYIIIATILISYFGALLFEKFPKYKKGIFLGTILADLSFLIYFKYFNFICQNLNALYHFNFHNVYNAILPIGISFYTFQALSYVVDVYKGEYKPQKSLYKLALFICLFPQLVAGPILKYGDIIDQINDREISLDKVELGIKRLIMGLAKKVLLANTIGLIVDSIFSQSPDMLPHTIAWLGTTLFGLQLFFDFSGYSDIAIGVGLIFGFKFIENFNYPYIAKSISEFWRRWHMSLMSWLKRYIYIPLGGNRNGLLIQIRNILIVFLISGIWHGASWGFIVWGLWFGVFCVLEKIINLKNIQQKYNKPVHNAIYHGYCLIVAVISFVFFRAENLEYARNYLQNMFGFMQIDPNMVKYSIEYYIGSYELLIILIAVLCSTPLFKGITNINNKWGKIFINIWFIVLFIITTAAIAADTYQPFIYFRF